MNLVSELIYAYGVYRILFKSMIMKLKKIDNIDVTLFRSVSVDKDKDTEIYHPMFTFIGTRIICIGKSHLRDFKYMEDNIEYMLEHEILHIIIEKVESEESSKLYDKIFPLANDLRKWMNG